MHGSLAGLRYLIYAGQSCYLKLANYHSPLGLPVSVIHSHVLRGAGEAAVQLPSG